MQSIHMDLELSPQMDERLEEISARLRTSRAQVLRKAIALIDIAARAKAEGRPFGIARSNEALATEIVGL